MSGWLKGTATLVACMLLGTMWAYAADDGYLGSAGCMVCHPVEGKAFSAHGHAFMVRPVTAGKAPAGAEAVTPPPGTDWLGVSYLLGGFSHYARFTDSTGNVMTGTRVQWSLDGKTHTAFKPEVPLGTLSYDCIRCHVTGWRAEGAYDGGVKNTLPGIPGVWFENNISCEACHGPGAAHAGLGAAKMAELRKEKKDLQIATGSAADRCKTCHARTDNNNIITVADDLVESRQQYSELTRSRKASFKVTCLSCHEPHATSHGQVGIRRKCLDCHIGKYAVEIKIKAMAKLSCEDCHMPYAARGAFDSNIQGYHKGDMRSHIFGISVDPAYTLNDGTRYVSLTSEGLARLTVEMTCYSCHKTGKAPDMTREKLLKNAEKVHK